MGNCFETKPSSHTQRTTNEGIRIIDEAIEEERIAHNRALDRLQDVQYRLGRAKAARIGPKGTPKQRVAMKRILAERRRVTAEINKSLSQIQVHERDKEALKKITFVDKSVKHKAAINKVFKKLKLTRDGVEDTLDTHKENMDDVDDLNCIVMGDIDSEMEDLDDSLDRELEQELCGTLLDDSPAVPIPMNSRPGEDGSLALLADEPREETDQSNKQIQRRRKKFVDDGDDPDILHDLLGADSGRSGFGDAEVLEFTARQDNGAELDGLRNAWIDELGC